MRTLAACGLVALLAGCTSDASTPSDSSIARADAGAADVATPTPDGGALAGDGAPDRTVADARVIVADAASADLRAADARGVGDMSRADGRTADATKSGDAGTRLRDICFKHTKSTAVGPDYDKYKPVYGKHCHGTNHQKIAGIKKVVFLGDSVTAGTFPTLAPDVYRARLTALLTKKFGTLEVKNCSAFGARVDDLLLKPHEQAKKCFPVVEKKKTLVIMTIGGNDMHAYAKDGAKGVKIADILKKADGAIKLMRDAVKWLTDPKRFPGGVDVVFANMYEFTDGTGDVYSCPVAALTGLKPWPAGRAVFIKMNEAFMKIAVDTKTDMIFMLENFCGHGFKAADPKNECYRGPGTKTWFDLTCIHPTPEGHRQIANMFMSVVNL